MVFGQRRKIEEMEHRLNSEVEFWKNELSKACNEKNYFATRALAAERSLADQLQHHCWEDPDKRVCREMCTSASKTLDMDADKDVPLHKAKDQSIAGGVEDASALLPLLPKLPQQHQQRKGRYARPSEAARATNAGTQVDPQPSPPTVAVSSKAQQTDADLQSDIKAAAMATELEAQLMKARTDLGAAQDNIAALEQELRCLKCALQSEQEATNATAAEVVTLKQEMGVVKGLSDDTANQAASLLQALGEAQAQNAKLLAELATKEDLVALLTQQLGDLQGAADALPTTPPRTPQPPLNLPSPAEQYGHSPVQHLQQPGACPRQRLLYAEQDTTCPAQAPSDQANMHCKDGEQPQCDKELMPKQQIGADNHGCAGDSEVVASMQDLPLPEPLASSSPCKQDGAGSPASSSSTVTAQYGASGLLGGEESKGDVAESASCQEPISDEQKKPQQLSVHCSSSSAHSSNSGVAPSTPAASTPGRLMRTNLSMTPKARLELQQQQQQQMLDKEALEASKRRLSRTPPMERMVSKGVNWGRGGSVEAFGEGGTTVMSIVRRFQ